MRKGKKKGFINVSRSQRVQLTKHKNELWNLALYYAEKPSDMFHMNSYKYVVEIYTKWQWGEENEDNS